MEDNKKTKNKEIYLSDFLNALSIYKIYILLFSLIITSLFVFYKFQQKDDYKIEASVYTINSFDEITYKNIEKNISSLYKGIGYNLDLNLRLDKEHLFELFFSKSFKDDIVEEAFKSISINPEIKEEITTSFLNTLSREVISFSGVVDNYSELKIKFNTKYPIVAKEFFYNYIVLVNKYSSEKVTETINSSLSLFEVAFNVKLNSSVRKKNILERQLANYYDKRSNDPIRGNINQNKSMMAEVLSGLVTEDIVDMQELSSKNFQTQIGDETIEIANYDSIKINEIFLYSAYLSQLAQRLTQQMDLLMPLRLQQQHLQHLQDQLMITLSDLTNLKVYRESSDISKNKIILDYPTDIRVVTNINEDSVIYYKVESFTVIHSILVFLASLFTAILFFININYIKRLFYRKNSI